MRGRNFKLVGMGGPDLYATKIVFHNLRERRAMAVLFY